jgi:hypothetical protein
VSQVRTRLVEGQRESSHGSHQICCCCILSGHLLSKLTGLFLSGSWLQDSGSAQQEEHPFLLVHWQQVQTLRECAECLAACGDEDGPRSSSGQKTIQYRQIFYIMPDQQPAAMR